MAYNDFLADRINLILKERNVHYLAKSMMGGLVYMVDEKMCFGILFDKKKNIDLMMARIGVDATEQAMKEEGCHPMDFTGRPMKGFVFIDPDGVDMDVDLEKWIDLCLAHNPFAKASKKKK
jgi:hypothetical protein